MSAVIHTLNREDLAGESIEERSLGIIQKLVPQGTLSEGEWRVVCRMVHTCGDPNLASEVTFHHDAIGAGIEALRQGSILFVDANMQRAGISLARLRQVNASYGPESVLCHVADADVALLAKEQRLARSLFAARKAAPRMSGAILAIGNAPVALLEINRMILEEGLRPALIIGFPVGFVHVEESKEELAKLPVPSIILNGRRGGSALAVSAIHALAIQALEGK